MPLGQESETLGYRFFFGKGDFLLCTLYTIQLSQCVLALVLCKQSLQLD